MNYCLRSGFGILQISPPLYVKQNRCLLFFTKNTQRCLSGLDWGIGLSLKDQNISMSVQNTGVFVLRFSNETLQSIAIMLTTVLLLSCLQNTLLLRVGGYYYLSLSNALWKVLLNFFNPLTFTLPLPQQILYFLCCVPDTIFL